MDGVQLDLRILKLHATEPGLKAATSESFLPFKGTFAAFPARRRGMATEMMMAAVNKRVGDNARKGPVRKRAQLETSLGG